MVEEELGVLGEGLGEEKEEEDGCFTLLDVFEACNTRLGELIQLKFSASVKKNHISHSRCILQIPTIRMWIIVLGTSRKI